MSSPEKVKGAAPCHGAGHLQGEDTPDPEVNQDQEKIMAVEVRTLTPHLRVTCYVNASSDCDVQGLTHLCEKPVIKTPEETYIDTGGPF